MPTTNRLCLFVKAPRPGQVKTRMQPELSKDQAASLYGAMVEDLLERLAGQPDYDLSIYYSPPDGREELTAWLGQVHAYRPQRGEHLGERMSAAFQDSLSDRYRKSIVIGSDIPDLNNSIISKAFQALDRSDVVLGPGRDGGYYLVGLKKSQPDIFKGITWSGDQVYPETARKIQQLNLSLTELSPLADLDTFEDVKDYWQRRESGATVNNPRLDAICSSFFA
jgi:rSAM/selenodomain-associated transferase 1